MSGWVPCSETVTGEHSTSDVKGDCMYCRRHIAPPARRPRPDPHRRSEVDDAYRYHYDPDWGANRYDV